MELIIGLEVIQKFVFLLRGQLNPGHHDEFFTGHVGFQVVETIWKPFQDFWLIYLKENSNIFHVIPELSSEDRGMLCHEIVLEADLIGFGEVLG